MNLVSIAEIFEAAAAALAALRLFQLGLYRSQAALTAFLAVSSLSLFALASVPATSKVYFSLYIACTMMNWLLAAIAVREVFALILNRYRGIRTAARWSMYVVLSVAVAASLAVSRAAWQGGASGHSALLFYTESLNRSVVLTLAIFIALFLFTMSRYPLHLSRNTLVSCGFFGALFLSEALSTLIDTLSPRLFSARIDEVELAVSATCFVLWGAMLRRESYAPKKITFNAVHEERLLRELDSLNAVLSRAVRK